jgi:DNA-binding transcriptional MocR family regulator
MPSETQTPLRAGIIELAVGEPDPALLPRDLIRAAAGRALADPGDALLSYGSREGPARLREAVARRAATTEGLRQGAGDLLVSAGNSQALELTLATLTTPGDVVLVEDPTYHLALGIVRDHPVEVVAVPLGDEGIEPDALEAVLAGLRKAGRRARLLYTIPTFDNPTGVSLAGPRRRRLLELATAHDVVVVEDDVYRELAYDGAAPPSLRATDTSAPVVRLGSFSKSLAPGLRLGWIDARADLRERLAGAGVLESGGCVAQFAAGVVGRVLESGDYDAHVALLRRTYTARRDALVRALREHLPAGCRFAVPAGGYFVWVTLPDDLSASELLPRAEALGVSFAPGARFSRHGADDGLRLSFTLYGEAALAEGARRLAAAIGAAAAHAG